MRDYVGNGNYCANFCENRFSGGFSPNRWNITPLLLFWLSCPVLWYPVLFFSILRPGRTILATSVPTKSCMPVANKLLLSTYKFRPDISIHGRDITTSGCWKQKAAILKFYFRFRFWPSHGHQHVILHWPTKLYANRMIADGVMTSYLFYKMAAIASKIYCRCLIWPRLIFRKAQIYRCSKFRQDISIHGRYITTSGFWKQRTAILKFSFQFRFWPFYRHRHVILHWPTKFYATRMIADVVMDFIFILQDGGHSVGNLLPVADLAMPEI